MTKLSILAIVGALTMTGIAAPAFAATNTHVGNTVPLCDSGSGATLDMQKSALATQLQLGLNADSSIDMFNGCFKVTTTHDGQTKTAFYDPDTLKLVAQFS